MEAESEDYYNFFIIRVHKLMKTLHCVKAELLHESNSTLHDIQILQFQHINYCIVPSLLLLWVNNTATTGSL